ncbi:thiamine pyrophosphate-binding protein [Neobacillus sp. Marseille-QA0830]
MIMTGGELLVRMLKAEGVPVVYGVCGGKLGTFLSAIYMEPSIEFVGTRHEANAAHMACATFHSTGKVGVCMGEIGAGASNMLPGVASAYGNNIPMLVITSNNPTSLSYPFKDMYMDLDNENLYKSITKWNAVVRNIERIPELVRRAFREALSGKPGPVQLDFPTDILMNSVEIDESLLDIKPEKYRVVDRPRGDAQQIMAAAELLSKAERPVLLAGGGVVKSEAAEEFRSIAKLLDAPATASQMGAGVVSSEEFIGTSGIIGGHVIPIALREADVVLIVGCRLSSWLWDGEGPLVRGWPKQKVIHIDISPSIIGKNTLIDVGIQGDTKSVLQDLYVALANKIQPVSNRKWTRYLVNEYSSYRESLENLANDTNQSIMHPATLAKEIGEFIKRDSFVVFDGGHTTFWSNDFTPILEPRTRFFEQGMGILGFGVPYAHAIKKLYPDRPVYHITGDGSFGFTMQELDTARRYGLPVIHIIHNNASWGIIKHGQTKRYGFEIGTDLSGTNYAEIARAFGCYGERVTVKEEIKPALQRAMDSGLPSVIDVEVHFDPHPSGKIFSEMGFIGLDKNATKTILKSWS